MARENPLKLAGGLTGGGLIVLFALYGDKFWVQARAAWLFMLELTKTAPLGVVAFFVAWVFGVLTILTLRRWVPAFRNKDARRFAIEAVGLVVSIALAWLQMRGPDASTFSGVLFGVAAGLLAPLTATALFALTSSFRELLKAPVDDHPEQE